MKCYQHVTSITAPSVFHQVVMLLLQTQLLIIHLTNAVHILTQLFLSVWHMRGLLPQYLLQVNTNQSPQATCHSHTHIMVLVSTGQSVYELCLLKRFVTGCCNAAPCSAPILFLVITISLGPV